MNEPRLPADSVVGALAQASARRGGRLLMVGGWVRDQLRGELSKDLDVEIFGLRPEAIDELLEPFGSIGPVGQHFPVWRLRGRALDIGYPREGALDYHASDPASIERAFQAAARHRDLTVNAIGWDPLEERSIDPWDGARDLEVPLLRAVDAKTFGSDPLRGLRVARLHARLEAAVDPATLALCRGLDLSVLPIERLTGELRRILAEPKKPSSAFLFLDRAGLLEFFSPIAALRGIPQDPRWHPEGDVFVHTLRVIDCARSIGADRGEHLDTRSAEILHWAALTHDLGKPATTTEEGGRIRSIGHEAHGAKLAREWLMTLRIAHGIVAAVEVLVAHHLAPAQFVSQGAGGRAYRRLARKLSAGGVSLIDLERVARADHLGRTTEEARAGRFEAGQEFLAAATRYGVEQGVREDIVSARDLMDRGVAPGPRLGRALARARALQDERGGGNPEEILGQVLREFENEKGEEIDREDIDPA